MNLTKAMHREERKLLAAKSKLDVQLEGIRAAINALASNGSKPHVKARHKLAGRKISAAHRRAIKAGWARRKKALAKAA